MKLYDKIKLQLDYNNSYSLKKTTNILLGEFDLAIKRKDTVYAEQVIDIANNIYTDFSATYRESEDYGATMSYMQQTWAKQFRNILSYFTKCMKDNFGVKNAPTIEA